MQMENIWIKKWDQQQEEFFVNQKEHHQVSSKLPTYFYGENVIFYTNSRHTDSHFLKKQNRVSTGLVPLGVIFQAKILKMKKILWTSKTTWIEEKLATTEETLPRLGADQDEAVQKNRSVDRVSAKRIFATATVLYGRDYPFPQAKLMLDRLKTKWHSRLLPNIVKKHKKFTWQSTVNV